VRTVQIDRRTDRCDRTHYRAAFCGGKTEKYKLLPSNITRTRKRKFKLDGTRWAAVDSASACYDRDLWPLTREPSQHVSWPRYICDQNWMKFPSSVFWDMVFTGFSGSTDCQTHSRRQTDTLEYSMPPVLCFNCGWGTKNQRRVRKVKSQTSRYTRKSRNQYRQTCCLQRCWSADDRQRERCRYPEHKHEPIRRESSACNVLNTRPDRRRNWSPQSLRQRLQRLCKFEPIATTDIVHINIHDE